MFLGIEPNELSNCTELQQLVEQSGYPRLVMASVLHYPLGEFFCSQSCSVVLHESKKIMLFGGKMNLHISVSISPTYLPSKPA